MEDQKEFVQMMKINRNAFIIIDKDKLPLNHSKKRIMEEIGLRNVWITQGKEIENYIPINVINKWLSKKNLNELKTEVSLNDKIEDIIRNKNRSFKYELKKSVYAKEIIDDFDVQDLDKFDLRKQMEILIETIKSWNL